MHLMNINIEKNSINFEIDNLIFLFQKKEFNLLIEKASDLLNKFPRNYMFYNLLGLTNVELKKNKEAIDFYETDFS